MFAVSTSLYPRVYGISVYSVFNNKSKTFYSLCYYLPSFLLESLLTFIVMCVEKKNMNKKTNGVNPNDMN